MAEFHSNTRPFSVQSDQPPDELSSAQRCLLKVMACAIEDRCADPRALRRMIACPGRLGLFRLSPRQRGLVAAQLKLSKSDAPISKARLSAFIKRLHDFQPITKTVGSSRNWSSQKVHRLSWLADHSGPGHYRRTRWNHDAEFVHNHVGCGRMLLWLIEATGVARPFVLAPKDVIASSKHERSACSKIRSIVPWSVIEAKLEAACGRK